MASATNSKKMKEECDNNGILKNNTYKHSKGEKMRYNFMQHTVMRYN